MDSTLFFVLKVDINDKDDLIAYSCFLKSLVNELVLYQDEDILTSIALIGKSKIVKCYSGDLIDNVKKGNRFKFINLKVDYRDREFPFIFDGFYNIELDITYSGDNIVNQSKREFFTIPLNEAISFVKSINEKEIFNK